MEYKVVDVFTDTPLKGNPVAVVLDATKLTTDQMQDIARWTNLSETTFVLPPTNGGSYKVRIFCPTNELPFAGHPTLGTCHALLDSQLISGESKIIQECGKGNVPIERLETGELQFALPVDDPNPISPSELEDLKSSLPGLNLIGQPAVVDSGPIWLCAQVSNSCDELLKYKPQQSLIAEISSKYGWIGYCVYSVNDDNSIELRTFAPLIGVNEDPVCGSGNASVAKHRNLCGPYIAYQGRAISRNGRILAESGSVVKIGGKCVTCVRGTLHVK